MSTIEQRVKAIVAEQLGVKEEEVNNDSSFVDDLAADSLDTVELEMALAESERIRDLVKDIMRAATVPQQGHEVQHIEELVLHAEESLAGELQKRGIVCKKTIAPGLPDVRVHAAGPLPEPAERWEVQTVAHVTPEDGRPSLLLDVGAHWPAKLAALACYGSQLVRAEGRRATAINDPAFLERIEDRARRWGRLGGVARAEALTTTHVPVVADLPGEPWRS